MESFGSETRTCFEGFGKCMGVDMNMGYLKHFVYDLHQNEAGTEAVTFSGNAGVIASSSNLMQ